MDYMDDNDNTTNIKSNDNNNDDVKNRNSKL
jgi:hypothetical protein